MDFEQLSQIFADFCLCNGLALKEMPRPQLPVAPEQFAADFFNAEYASTIQDHLRDYYFEFYDYLVYHEVLLDYIYQLQLVFAQIGQATLEEIWNEYLYPQQSTEHVAEEEEEYLVPQGELRDQVAHSLAKAVHHFVLYNYLYYLFPLRSGWSGTR